jgi:hypothetical protein
MRESEIQIGNSGSSAKKEENHHEKVANPSIEIPRAGNVSDKHLASPRTTVRRSTPQNLSHQRQLFDPREPQSRSTSEQSSCVADTRNLGK